MRHHDEREAFAVPTGRQGEIAGNRRPVCGWIVDGLGFGERSTRKFMPYRCNQHQFTVFAIEYIIGAGIVVRLCEEQDAILVP